MYSNSVSDIPSISVIIPVYNRGRTILRCLRSVLEQTFAPLEVIVVDDSSTDDTMKSISVLTQEKIRCISLEKRSGAQAARNRGIMEARGEWIAFLDSDDEWETEKLEKQVEALGDVGFDPWTVVHTNAFLYNASTQKKKPTFLPEVHGENVYHRLLSAPAPMYPSILVSRAALEKIDFLDEGVPSHQEWDTCIRLARHCRFIHLRDCLFTYHISGNDALSRSRVKDIEGYQYVIDKYADAIRDVCGPEAWQRHMECQLIRSLDFRLWEKADYYIGKISRPSFVRTVLLFCRLFRLNPRFLMSLKEVVTRQRGIQK